MDVTPGARGDDPESLDAEPVPSGATKLDVTPREAPPTSVRSGRGRGMWAIGLLAVVVIGLGVVLFNGLRDASTFFYNVDEAVAKRSELQGERFRMQGNVVDGSVHETSDGVDFVLRFDGVEVPVQHQGDPPELFGPKIPVVLEGTFVGDTFESDQILIRHDASYDEENQDRIKDANRDAEQGNGLVPDDAQGATTGGASG